MQCAWQAFLNLLPVRMRQQVDKQGKDRLLELRLRLGRPPQMRCIENNYDLNDLVRVDDLQFCINVTSRYSPWATETIGQGYITAPGGHRVGICGEAVLSNGIMRGIRNPTSVSIRVSRDFFGIAADPALCNGSVLIIGCPGSGKTTFLRDLIRRRSDFCKEFLCVVDEKEEIFPLAQGQFCFNPGKNTDVISGCNKSQGIITALRNMGPDVIAVDEITAAQDCEALLQTGWCGVKLLATAHAGNREELFRRPIYKPLLDSKLFDTLVIVHKDKSYHTERMIK